MKKYFFGILLILGINAAFAERVLNVYIASNYITDETIDNFQKKCNCKVFLNYFGDPQEMTAKIAAGAEGYDVIVGTGFAIEELYKMGKLSNLDMSKIPNVKYIESKYLHQNFDPQNKFSIPYGFTVTMLGYNKTKLDSLGIVPNTWAVIFDEKYLRKLKGHVTVFDSQRNVYAAALLYLGKDPNSTKPEDMVAVRKLIANASKYWARYDTATYYRSLLSGDTWVAMSYSSDLYITTVDAKKAKLSYQIDGMVQKEGNMIELDNLVIPKSSKNVDLAYMFINEVSLPKNAYSMSSETGSSAPNLQAISMLPKDITSKNWIYPTPQQKIYGFTAYAPKDRIWVNEDWTEVKMECHG